MCLLDKTKTKNIFETESKPFAILPNVLFVFIKTLAKQMMWCKVGLDGKV